jgi:hypothetical protein
MGDNASADQAQCGSAGGRVLNDIVASNDDDEFRKGLYESHDI